MRRATDMERVYPLVSKVGFDPGVEAPSKDVHSFKFDGDMCTFPRKVIITCKEEK
jgi:hypothetical protein